MKRVNFKIRRKLKMQIGNQVQEAELVIGGLTQKNSDGPWSCDCTITGIIPKKKAIYGEDQLQTLLLALSFCAETLKSFNRDGKQVWWLESGDQGGLRDFKRGL